MPLLAFSQRESVAADTNPASRGQAVTAHAAGKTARGFASAPKSRRVALHNIEKILMRQTKSQRLLPGAYVVSSSPQGYKLMATISPQGRADRWHVVDPKGRTVALMNNNGGDGEVDLEGCANKLIQDVADCDQYAYANKYHYKLCLQGAWANWIRCLGGIELKRGTNLTPVGGAVIVK
jgi:hypothetical protein